MYYAQLPCTTKQASAGDVRSYRAEPLLTSPTPQPPIALAFSPGSWRHVSDGGSTYMKTMVLSSPLMVSTPMLLVIRSVSPSPCPAPPPTALAAYCLPPSLLFVSLFPLVFPVLTTPPRSPHLFFCSLPPCDDTHYTNEMEKRFTASGWGQQLADILN
jgi:hypothetical protein